MAGTLEDTIRKQGAVMVCASGGRGSYLLFLKDKRISFFVSGNLHTLFYTPCYLGFSIPLPSS